MWVLSPRALLVFGIAGALVTVTLSSPRAADFWYRGFCGCADSPKQAIKGEVFEATYCASSREAGCFGALRECAKLHARKIEGSAERVCSEGQTIVPWKPGGIAVCHTLKRVKKC